ncbi:hypothetical protein D3C80_20180 [compost metagenome]
MFVQTKRMSAGITRYCKRDEPFSILFNEAKTPVIIAIFIEINNYRGMIIISKQGAVCRTQSRLANFVKTRSAV